MTSSHHTCSSDSSSLQHPPDLAFSCGLEMTREWCAFSLQALAFHKHLWWLSPQKSSCSEGCSFFPARVISPLMPLPRCSDPLERSIRRSSSSEEGRWRSCQRGEQGLCGEGAGPLGASEQTHAPETRP